MKDTSEIFGENVFSLSVMKARLPKETFKEVKAALIKGDHVDPAFCAQPVGSVTDIFAEPFIRIPHLRQLYACISRAGSLSSTRAMDTRCFSPPESFRPRLPTTVSSPSSCASIKS